MVSCHSRTNISLLTTSTQHQTVTILTTPSPPPPPHFSDHLSVLLLHNTYLVLVLYYTLSLSLSPESESASVFLLCIGSERRPCHGNKASFKFNR